MTAAALPFIVAATFFMEYLDTTIVATALPQMARSFGVGPNEVSLGMIAYGGSRMPRPVIERAMQLLPDVEFVNAYGLTETSSTIAILGPADHRDAFSSLDLIIRARLGSAGLRDVPLRRPYGGRDADPHGNRAERVRGAAAIRQHRGGLQWFHFRSSLCLASPVPVQ